MDLDGKVVVITGGGAGIGAAMARAMAKANARQIVVTDINYENAQSVADEVNGSAMMVDVAKEEQIIDLVDTVEQQHGPIDLFCSNAGFVTNAGLEDTNERITQMWEVHVMAHIYAARAVLPSDDRKWRGIPTQYCLSSWPSNTNRVSCLLGYKRGGNFLGSMASYHAPPSRDTRLSAMPASGSYGHNHK